METIYKLTPQIIAKSETRYCIPIYQRLFEWDGDKITQLLDDLLAASKEVKTDKSYYIGMLTATAINNDLVDGQQRFTVMNLIGIVFKEYYNKWEDFLLLSGSPRLTFRAREEDERYLSSKIKGESCDDINIKMEAGINEIRKWIDAHSNEFKPNLFAQYIYENISFFISKLPSTYQPKDLNKYFESMNSLGRNLESHEILKVDSLKKLPVDSDKDLYTHIWNIVSDMDRPIIRKKSDKNIRESEEAYHNRFRSLISTINCSDNIEAIRATITSSTDGINDLSKLPQDIKITSIRSIKENKDSKPTTNVRNDSYHSMINFPEFLLQVLYLQLGVSSSEITVNEFFDIHKLPETFKKYTGSWNQYTAGAKEFFLNLLKYRLLYDYYIIRIPNNEDVDYKLELRESTSDDDSSDNKKILNKFQSMLYAGSSSKTFYRWVAPLLKEVSQQKEQKYDDLYQFLRGIENKIYTLDVVGNDNINLRYDTGVDTHWFRRLDFILWKRYFIDKIDDQIPGLNSDIIGSFKFRRGGRSIEHLHPQNEDENAEWSNSDNIHRFGNLALISNSFNSEQSNDTLSVKFARIERQVETNQIQSIKLYIMYLLSNKTGNNWTETQMLKHEKDVIQLLIAT